MIRKERTVDVLPADLDQFRRVPAVAAQQRDVNAVLLRLSRDQSDLSVITRNKNSLRDFRLDGRQLRIEIGVAFAVALSATMVPPIFLKFSMKTSARPTE